MTRRRAIAVPLARRKAVNHSAQRLPENAGQSTAYQVQPNAAHLPPAWRAPTPPPGTPLINFGSPSAHSALHARCRLPPAVHCPARGRRV